MILWSRTTAIRNMRPRCMRWLCPAANKCAVQHHRAHIASVLAERGAWDETVVGVSLDGTGYGDDGTIWGGEIFVGSVRRGFERVAHLRQAALPGGDAAAQYPVQAAAGFLAQIDDIAGSDCRAVQLWPALSRRPATHCSADVRTFPTTSMGRLFDAAAALLGFVRETTFEGQAAIWVEQLASRPSAPPCGLRILFHLRITNSISGRCLRAVIPTGFVDARPARLLAHFNEELRRDCVRPSEPSARSAAFTPSSSPAESFRTSLLLEDLKPLARRRRSSRYGPTTRSLRTTAASASARRRSLPSKVESAEGRQRCMNSPSP